MYDILSLLQNYALPFILVICAVVFVHEFGHYLLARMSGIRVVSFSIGFGPKLFSWKDRHGTEWRIACLPFGGYVKMFGDADAASSPDEEALQTMTEAEKKVSFFYQPVYKRIAVVAAGPLFNYLFAIVLLAVLFVSQGQPFSPPVVSSVQEKSAAFEAGILPGDRILAVDDEDVTRFEDIRRIISMNSGTAVALKIVREGVEQVVSLTPQIVIQEDRFGGKHSMGRIGIVTDKVEHRKLGVLDALWSATKDSWDISLDTLKAVGQIIAGTRGTSELGGPLRIAEMSGNIVQEGVWALVWFMAVISINLGLINILPIPLLDGGHLLFYVCEAVLRRPLSERTQEYGMRLGLLFVVSLMLFATWNDLVHLDVFARIVRLFS